MVDQMCNAVLDPVNKKVAFLTFKIVEETVKRACLKHQVERLMPINPITPITIKNLLKDTSGFVDGEVTSIDRTTFNKKSEQLGQMPIQIGAPEF